MSGDITISLTVVLLRRSGVGSCSQKGRPVKSSYGSGSEFSLISWEKGRCLMPSHMIHAKLEAPQACPAAFPSLVSQLSIRRACPVLNYNAARRVVLLLLANIVRL